MRKVILSEICDISSGGTPSRNNPEYFKGDIPWAKISDIENSDSGFVYETEEKISVEGLKNIRGRLFPKGTLLFAMYGSIGKVAIAGRELSTNQAILGIRPKTDDQIDMYYLKCWFDSNKQRLIKQGRGVALKNLSATIIRGLEIELPPIDDQKRIAYLLGKVERLIEQRKQHIKQLDDLLKSIFLEMFGDPVRNKKGWDIDSLASFGSFKNGLNFHKGETGVEVRYLGVGDFGSLSKISNINSLSLISLNALPSEDYFLCDGDIVFVRSNGNRELVGRCVAVYPNDKKVTYSGFCIRYRMQTSGLNVTYLTHLFRMPSFRRTLLQGGQGANIQNINQKILTALKIPTPDIDLQNQFAAIVEKVEALKALYQESLTDLEHLYGALSQKAFKGELDLSRVPLPSEPEESPEEAADEEVLTEEPEAEQTNAFVLSAPDMHKLLGTPEGREEYLQQCFKEYLAHMQKNKQEFSLDRFFMVLNVQLVKLKDKAEEDSEVFDEIEGFDPHISQEDYELGKDLLFQALEHGQLEQQYRDEMNEVYLVGKER